MRPGSLYCHFANKEDLLAAVHAEGACRICEAVCTAAERRSDPWERLEAACEAHLESLLNHCAYAKVVTSVGPHSVPELADSLIAQRDAYEQLSAGFIDALPRAGVRDSRAVSNCVGTARNWAGSHPSDGGGAGVPADILVETDQPGVQAQKRVC